MMPGLCEYLQKEPLESVRIGLPIGVVGKEELLKNPTYSTAISLLKFDKQFSIREFSPSVKQNWLSQITHKVQSVLDEVF